MNGTCGRTIKKFYHGLVGYALWHNLLPSLINASAVHDYKQKPQVAEQAGGQLVETADGHKILGIHALAFAAIIKYEPVNTEDDDEDEEGTDEE
jgi:hypothetical protein